MRRMRAAGFPLWLEQIATHHWEINDLPNDEEPVPGRRGGGRLPWLPLRRCASRGRRSGQDVVCHVQNCSQVQGP